MSGVFYPGCIAQFNVLFDNGVVPPPSRLFAVEPKSATITLNSFKEADTFELTFDAKDFPFTPELIKNAGVAIYLFQGKSLEERNQKKEIYRTNTVRASTGQEQERVLIGVVDEAVYEADARSGGSWFKVVGRDYTALFLDRVWAGPQAAPFKGNLIDTVQQIADVATNWLTFNANGSLGPGPAQVDKNNGSRILVEAYDPNKGFTDQSVDTTVDAGSNFTKQRARVPSSNINKRHKQTSKLTVNEFLGSTGRQALNSKGAPRHPHDEMSYWDLILDICIHAGARATIDGDVLRVFDPSDIFDLAENTPVITMTFGQDVEKFEISRKLGKESIPQFVLYGYDPSKKKAADRQLIVKYPADKDLKSLPVQRGTIKEIPTGLTSLDTMKRMARGMYTELSRTEGITTIATKDLMGKVPQVHPDPETNTDIREELDISLLELEIGQPLYVQFDDLFHEQFANLTIAQRKRILDRMGYAADVAQLVAENWEYINTYHDRGLYIRGVTYTWDTHNGVGIEIKAINYINPDLYDVDKNEKKTQVR